MYSPKRSVQFEEPLLVKQAMTGDLNAFNQLVLNYQNIVYGQAFALLGDPDAAEDATQESFVKAFQALNSYHGGSFRLWLLKIVTNTAYDLMRRVRRHPNQSLYPLDDNDEEVESAYWLVDPAACVETTVEQNEISSTINQLLDQLPPVYRSVITLIDIHEFEYTEAAEILRVPIGTVKSRLARARLQMQAKLSQYLGRSTDLSPMDEKIQR